MAGRLLPRAQGGEHLIIEEGERQRIATPINERTFTVSPENSDGRTITFSGFSQGEQPRALYDLVWDYPRVERP
jgi:hypothetical protein